MSAAGGRIELPWPPKELSPNARVHYRVKRGPGSKGETYQTAAWALAKEAGVSLPGEGWISVFITFCPPDRRKRDIDNMFASIKDGLDGIARAAGADDSRFGTFMLTRGTPIKGGKVIVEVAGG